MPSVQREAFKLLQLVRRLQKCMGGSVVLKWVRLQLRPAETPHMILKVRLMEAGMDSRAWNIITNAASEDLISGKGAKFQVLSLIIRHAPPFALVDWCAYDPPNLARRVGLKN